MKTINIWHIIDEKWNHITQVIKKGSIEFYTDGKYECSRKTDSEGKILQGSY